MTTVYALQSEDMLIALFSTLQMATEAQRQYGTGEVNAWVVDAYAELIERNWSHFQLRILHDGIVTYVREGVGEFEPHVWIASDFSCMYVDCRAESQEAAISFANVQRVIAIQEGHWPEPYAYWALFNAANGFAIYPLPKTVTA